MALYPGQPCESATELSETLTQYNYVIVLKFLPSLPSQSTSTKENLTKTAERNMKDPGTSTHTSFILA